MPLNLSRIRALCFDVDGTLCDTDDQMVAQLSRWLRPFNFLLPKKDLPRIARRIVMASETPANIILDLPNLIGLDDELYNLADWIARRASRKPKVFWLIPGVKETLADLSRRYPLAVVSARDTWTTRLFLDQFSLTPFFQCIAAAQTCKHTKPFPDPILWAARQMNVSPETCLMIGDTSLDIRAGKAAGAQTIGVLCGFGGQAELRRKGADMILSETSELVHVLED